MQIPARIAVRSVALLLCLTAWGQTNRFEGQTIREVRYEPAQQPLSAPDLERVQHVRAGEKLRTGNVASTIDAMFATGRYEDVQVDAAPAPGADGVVVRFITRGTRFVGHVGAAGKVKAPPDEGQLVNATNLELGTRFHPEDLAAAQKSIELLFRDNGLYDATAHLETTDHPETQEVDVLITVHSGKRARYDDPVVNKTGQRKDDIADSTIIRATGWRIPMIHRWRAVSATLTRRGIDSIERKYESKDRLAATVTLKEMPYDPETRRVKPRLEIDAGPVIRVRATETKVSKRLLKRFVPIYEEGAVDRDLLVEGARNLRDHFQSQGYIDAEVTFRELPATGDERTIEYAIARGAKQKLTHLEIQGNQHFKTDLLEDRMFLRASSFRYRGGRYSDAFLHRDEATITSFYKENGYRDVKVASAVQRGYRGNPADLAVTIKIEEGPQWTVAHLDVHGLDLKTQTAVLAKLHSLAGKPYSDLSVAHDRSEILTVCHSGGFAKAALRVNITPAGAPNQVTLEYVVQPGTQEFVRDIIFGGLGATRPNTVMQSIKFAKGDPLSFPKLREAQHDLYDRGIFAKVNTAIQNTDGDERQHFVLFDFTEAHRYNLTLGIGAELARIGGTASSVNAPQQNSGFVPRLSVTLDRLNFFGLGQTLTLQTRLSTLEQRASISYTIPRAFDIKNSTFTITTLYDVSRDVLTFASRREEATFQWSQKLSKHSTILGRFSYRRVDTSDVVIPSLLVPQLLQPVRIGILSGDYVQDHRDNPADGHSGMYNTIDAGVASGIFGSERSFARVLARNATYHKLSKNLVLARQTTVGVILPFSTAAGLTASDSVPLPERFFAGGSLSNRGLPENQAGPRDVGTPAGPGGTATQPTGFPLGGNAEFFNSIELRFPLIGDNIGGVLFHDAGNVYTSASDFSFRVRQRNAQDFNYMVHAAGFGLRYKTPIGPVRADFAYSINPPHYVGFKGTLNDLLTCNPNLPPSFLPGACQPVSQGVSHFQFFFSIGQTF